MTQRAMKFNKAYSDLICQLPPSLVNEAWMRLITRKRSPMTENEASTVNPLVESFLRHEVDRYQKKLKYQRRSWPLLKNLSYGTIGTVKTHIDMLTKNPKLKILFRFVYAIKHISVLAL